MNSCLFSLQLIIFVVIVVPYVFLIYCLYHPFKIPSLIDLVHHGSGLLMFRFVLMSQIVKVLCTVFFKIQLTKNVKNHW